MVGVTGFSKVQLRAIAVLRWQLFLNSLRSVRGRLNLVSRSIAALLVTGAGIGGAIVLGAVAFGMASQHNFDWIAIPFWIVLIFWQLFPVMATAFTHNIDASSLLRFPLSYTAYFGVRMVFGSLDIATALGLCWSVGLFLGISTANMGLAVWALLATGSLVLLNVVVARMIFVWIEHWLSTRRSREIMGVLFLAMLIGFQVGGPIIGRYSRQPVSKKLEFLARLLPFERWVPPGLAAASLRQAANREYSSALSSVGLVVVYAVGAAAILHLRLRAQYRGETSSWSKRKEPSTHDLSKRQGWKLPILSGPMSAVFEKELRYFSRSGPMLFTVVMPVIMVFVLWGGRRALMGQQMGFIFPVGTAYCLLVMTNIVYNSFGGDGAGMQFFLFSPISFRRIVAAKNLAQLAILFLDVLLLYFGVSLIFQYPRPRVLIFTFAWLLFAAPLNFMMGNLLSVYSPKRIEYAVFGRQRAPEGTILVSLAVQLTVIGIGALALFVAQHYRSLWVGTLLLSALAIPSLISYFVLLGRMDRIALRRRDVLTGELCKA